MSGSKTGHNAPTDVRILKTTQKEARVADGKSDTEEPDVKQKDHGHCTVKNSNARDVRGYSGKSYSSSSRKQQEKPRKQFSTRAHGVNVSGSSLRREASSKGKIWEPEADRGGGHPTKQQSYSSLRKPRVTSEADTSTVSPGLGGIHRADTHTGGVLHVDLAARLPKRAISEGGVGRRAVEKEEEEGEGSDIFYRVTELEERLSGSLARWNGRPASFSRIEDICSQLQEETKRCLWTRGLRTFLKSDLCGRLWRGGHHPVVEGLRRTLGQQTSPEEKDGIRDICLHFLDMASVFYREVMSELQKKLNFTVPDLLDSSRMHSSEVLCAKVLCHQLYLALGDLARYAEQVKEKPDWSKARSYYTKAQQLMPKNGKSYNQLAVIAINAQRRLDAVYYNIRSLTAGTPFLGARESLLGLLHEAGSKVESPKKKKEGGLDGGASSWKNDRKTHSKNPSGQREAQEVWVFPTRTLEEVKKMMSGKDMSQELDGQLNGEGHSQHSDSLPELVDGAPSSELIKNAMKQFLTVHAKMYTKIGYDTLGQAVTSFLSTWMEYLTHQVSQSDGVLFLKMAVINFFSIHNTSGDGSCQGRLRLMGVALSFMLEVTAVAVQCCLSHLARGASSSFRNTLQWEETQSAEVLSDEARAGLFEVDHLLVQVKVSFDWLVCQGRLWWDCAAQVDPSVWRLFWSHSADLLNKLHSVLPHATLEQVALYEDRHLQGFAPLADALGPIDYTSKYPTQEESLKQCLQRVSCLMARGRELSAASDKYVCLHYLEFSSAEQRFYCTSKEVEEGEEEDIREVAAFSNSESEEEEKENEKEEEAGIGGSKSPSSPVDGNIGLLRAEREELTREVSEKEKAKERVKDYLTMQATEGCGKVFVFPKYLVPDTNGFIDHLPQLVQLVECGHFVLAVPLTVIEELEGIAKGSSSAGQIKHEHSSLATHGAKEALSLLRGWFSSKSPSVRTATVKGELLTGMDYATVEKLGGAAATNDDFILASCSSVNTRTSKTDIHSTGVISMVVLLTADRNLRVKAHAAGVPVRDFHSFMSWVKPALKLKEGN